MHTLAKRCALGVAAWSLALVGCDGADHLNAEAPVPQVLTGPTASLSGEQRAVSISVDHVESGFSNVLAAPAFGADGAATATRQPDGTLLVTGASSSASHTPREYPYVSAHRMEVSASGVRAWHDDEVSDFAFDPEMAQALADYRANVAAMASRAAAARRAAGASETGSFRSMSAPQRLAVLEAQGFEVRSLGGTQYELVREAGGARQVSTYDAGSHQLGPVSTYVDGQLAAFSQPVQDGISADLYIGQGERQRHAAGLVRFPTGTTASDK